MWRIKVRITTLFSEEIRSEFRNLFFFLQASVNLCLNCLDVRRGVPQGRVIGPPLFSLRVLSEFLTIVTDDTQLYTSVSPGSLHDLVARLTDMNNLMTGNVLKINDNRNASCRTG